MDTVLVLLAILLAVVVGFWGPLRGVRRALGLGHLVSTGHAFLILGGILGLLLGGRADGMIDDLSPIVSFVACWVGFAAGVRFEWRLARAVPVRAYAVAFAPGAAAAVMVGAVALGVLSVASDLSGVSCLAVAAVVGAAGASSGPSLAALVRSRRAGRASEVRSVLRMVELSTGVDDALVVLLALVAFPLLYASNNGGDAILIASVFIAGLVGGVGLGATIWLFLGGTATENERLLLGLAMLAVIAGFAEWLSLSHAAVAATAAVALVNLPGERFALLVSAIRRVERPAVVILMTLIGVEAGTQLHWVFFAMLAVLTVLRIGVKVWTGRLVPRTVPGAPGLRASRLWGLGLAPMGTLGVVVVVELMQALPDPLTRSLLAAAAAASLLCEAVAPWLMLRLLRSLSGSAPGQGAAA